jgi:autotransporter-associated beta strand protein
MNCLAVAAIFLAAIASAVAARGQYVLPTYDTSFGSGGYVTGVAVNPSTGTVYVGRNYVNPSQNCVESFNTAGLNPQTFVAGAQVDVNGVAVDAAGNVYVANETGNPTTSDVQMYNSSGGYAKNFGLQYVGEPFGVAVSPNGQTVYIADCETNNIWAYPTSGGNASTFYGGNEPGGVAVDPNTGVVYVSQFSPFGTVGQYSSSGTLLNTIGGYGSGPGQYKYPLGLTVSAKGNLYVADQYNGRVDVFNSSGAALGSFGQGIDPQYVAVSPTGEIYVTDGNYNQVDKYFDPGEWVSGTPHFGMEGAAVGPGQIPAGSAFLGTSLSMGANQGLQVDGALTILSGGYLSHVGNVSAGSLTNNGWYTINGGSLTASGTVTNNATMALNGGNVTASQVTNSYGASLTANGTVIGSLTNQGTLTLAGQLSVSSAFTNSGTVIIAAGQQLAGAGFASNSAAGTIRGDGAITMSLANVGGLIYANGTSGLTLSNFSNNQSGGELRVADGDSLTVLGPNGSYWSNYSATITLQGPNATLNGSQLDNDSNATISGQGRVSNTISNNGTIRAVGGQLLFSGNFSNGGAGTVESATGTSIILSQGLSYNGGLIALSGGSFDNNGNAMTNAGSILGNGTLSTGGLSNNGTMTFSDGNSSIFGSVTNNSGGTITTYGTSAATTIITFYGLVTNSPGGNIQINSSTARFLGGFTNKGTYITDPADNYFTGLTIGASGVLQGGTGDRFFVTDPFTSAGQINLAGNSQMVVENGGSMTQTGGTLHLGPTATLTAGTVQINGGTLLADGPAATITANLVYASPSASTYQGVLAGGGNSLSVNNVAAVLILSGANTYGGGTSINNGTLQFANTAAMPASGTVSVSSGATLAVNAGGTGEFGNGTSGNGTIGGLLSGLGGQSGGRVSFASGSVLGIDTTNAGGSLTYSGNITNPGLGLIKLGAGTLVLSGANTYSGGTSVTNGTLQLGPVVGSNGNGFNGNGFNGNGLCFTVNSSGFGSTSPPVGGGTLTLTDNNAYEARSAFYDWKVPVNAPFTASFVYQAAGGKAADGVAFVLQNSSNGPNALGLNGGGLGYNGISPSAALELNIYTWAPGGVGMALVTGGGSGQYTPTGNVNLASGDPIQVQLAYDPPSQTLTTTLTDWTTLATFTTTYNANLATALGGTSAYIGFTGGTGGWVSTQTISNFSFATTAGTPAPGLDVLPTSTALALSNSGSLDLCGGNQTVGSLSGAGTVTNSSANTSAMLTVGGDNSSRTFSGILQNGAGTLAVTKTGSGNWTLTGYNTYTGGTTISGGTLQLGDGATGNGQVAGNITDNATLVFANNTGWVYNGQISGSGGVIFNGSNAGNGNNGGNWLTLTGNNGYNGGTTINSGVVQISGDSQLGAVPGSPTVNITLNGGELFNNASSPTLNANRTIYLGPNGGYVRAGWGQPFTINGRITGPGGLGIVWDGGPLTLNGTSDYSGGTTIGTTGNDCYGPGSAQVRLGISNALPVTGSVSLGVNPYNPGSTATLDLYGFNAEINGLSGGANAVVDNTSGGGACTLTVGNGGAPSAFAGVIQNSSGSVGLVKTGSGTQVLSGANTYSGGTTINNGTLQFALTTAMPAAGTVSVGGGATLAVNAGGTGEFGNGTSGYGTIGGLLSGLGGQSGGGVSFASGSILGIDTTNAGGSLTYSGNIANAGLGLTKLGAGTLVLNGANSYTGPTTVNNGTLQLNVGGGAGTLTGGGAIVIDSGGTVLGGATDALGYYNHTANNGITINEGGTLSVASGCRLSMDRGVTCIGGTIASQGSGDGNGSYTFRDYAGAQYTFTSAPDGTPSTISATNFGLQAATTFNVTRGGGPVDLNVTGNLVDSFNPGSLIKTGAGVMVLSGANTYSAGTSVNGGTLELQGAAFSTTAGNYTIAAGAVLNLNGLSGNAIPPGTTSFSGGGTLQISGGALNNAGGGGGDKITMNLGSGALIDVQSGASLTNGGWQVITWTNNLASLNVNGTFDIWDGNPVQVDALTGSGTVTHTSYGGTQNFEVGVNNGSGTFAGTITDTPNHGLGLVKAGSGTQVLSGANSFTGGTSVTGGVLAAENRSAIPSGSLLAIGANGSVVLGTPGAAEPLGLPGGGSAGPLGSQPSDSGDPQAGAPINPVPEPGTLLLLAAAAACGLAGRRRRKGIGIGSKPSRETDN